MEMEEQAVSLQQALRSNALAVDSKLTLLNSLKSNIKHLRVPDTAQAPIFDSVRLAIGSHSSSALVSAGFATLAHLLKRLHLQNQTAMINAQTAKLLPVLLDRMGDGRESYRTAAAQSLCDLWPYCHAEVERLIRETALVGSNVRAKDSAMHWLVKVRHYRLRNHCSRDYG